MPEQPSVSAGDSFHAIKRVLRRRWWVILACLIVVPVAAFGYARSQKKQYVAQAQILLDEASPAEQANASSPTAQTALLSTELDLASLNLIADRTARALGTSGGLPGSVSVTNDGTSAVFKVSATEKSAGLAATVANAYAGQYIAWRADLNRAQIAAEQADIRRQLRSNRSASTAAALNHQLQQLSTLGVLQNTNMRVVAPATPPSSPSSPKTKQIVLGGVALGLVLGILLAAVFSVIDRRLRDPSEVAAVLQGPILGAIPRSRAVRKVWLQNGRQLKGVDQESFAMVYANMSYYNEQPVRSVLVTSPAGGEGKSTVAWNLAVIAARSGARVLLIEADLRRPAFSSRMKIQPSAGLSDVLQGGIDPIDVLLPVALNGKDGGQNGSGAAPTGSLSVLLAGPNSPALSASTPLALLRSERMRSVLEAAERLHDLVVIDSPPTCLVSDAIPLIKHVSGVLVVTRVRMNTRESARQLRDQLANLRARTLGVVVNGVDSADGYEDPVPARIES